jgi:hypothetical protein
MSSSKMATSDDALHRYKALGKAIGFNSVRRVFGRRQGAWRSAKVMIDSNIVAIFIACDGETLDRDGVVSLLTTVSSQPTMQIKIQRIREADRSAPVEKFTEAPGMIIKGGVRRNRCFTIGDISVGRDSCILNLNANSALSSSELMFRMAKRTGRFVIRENGIAFDEPDSAVHRLVSVVDLRVGRTSGYARTHYRFARVSGTWREVGCSISTTRLDTVLCFKPIIRNVLAASRERCRQANTTRDAGK